MVINGNDAFSYYGLILSSKSIEAPKPKTKTVDIVGGDGVLDLTEYFGATKFNNRNLTFTFSAVQTNSEFISSWTFLLAELHGKVVRIVLDEDSEYYYIGRSTLSYKRDKNVTTITMKVDAEPFKMKVNDTVVSQNGSGTVLLYNGSKRVVPTITTTAEAQIVFGELTVNVNAGTHIVPEIELQDGENVIGITSTGTTTFTYEEGDL